jgi:hypothetical protein
VRLIDEIETSTVHLVAAILLGAVQGLVGPGQDFWNCLARTVLSYTGRDRDCHQVDELSLAD